ncbi:TerD family protein [Nocardia terpenica]|uniref:TerD domain-containing protein n=1 Tax=Nocardia terpenica TaxID=455432 RepID=A0A291RFN5_9NOCA|nr:TerD family protein [Nocardia terpenica]ATL66135.1 hypothetical protein CRH09_07840 [Nocardia terpenica]
MAIPLLGEDGLPIEYLLIGLGWDPLNRRRWYGSLRVAVDLNLAVLLFADDHLTDVVYHEQLTSTDGAVRLLGDNVTGEGPGADEVVTVDLTRLSPAVTTVIPLVTCYTGQTFEQVDNGFCQLVDAASEARIARYDLPRGPHTGLVVGALDRADPAWQYREIMQPLDASHPVDAIPHVRRYLLAPGDSD